MPFASLFEVVAQLAQQAGDALAAIDEDKNVGQAGARQLPARLTYSDLREASMRLSASLATRLAAVQRSAAPSSQAQERALVATRMRRGNDWYCLFCAAARLQAPLVALSTDLPDKALENARNAKILAEHRPGLLVVDEGGERGIGDAAAIVYSCPADTGVVDFAQLWAEVAAEAAGAHGISAASPDVTLCFCYTGGSTGASRCVRVTHCMALHEVVAYPQVVAMGRSDRILQQHSVYWAASTYGEVDIALAFGCALIFCEAWGSDDVAAAITRHQATFAGLVPSILATLEPTDVPSLKVIFTWGEALQAKTAKLWARRVHLVDLLISTECWLSLYADWSAQDASDSAIPLFVPLPGTKVRLREIESGSGASEAGELLVSGPMVSPGYTDPQLNAAVILHEAGVIWYCTRDCVEQRGGGFAFAGRADDLVKVGGVWVDVREVEDRLAVIEGVREVLILGREVFVTLHALHDGLVPALRRTMPPGFALFMVPALPRKSGTDKVDRAILARLVGQGSSPGAEAQEADCCNAYLLKLSLWYSPLGLVALGALLYATWAPSQEVCYQGVGVLVLAWRFVCQLVWRFACQLVWRLTCLIYIVLISFHWPRMSKYFYQFPLGIYGAMVVAVAFLPCSVCLLLAAPGMCKAGVRRRLLSWPAVCAIGFPIWVLESGKWWTQQGCCGILRWYATVANRRMREVYRLLAPKLCRHVLRHKECAHCRKLYAADQGHIDPTVEPFWYCKKCWRMYHRHRQCTRCKEWRTSGQDTSAGEWVCSNCFQLLAEVAATSPAVECRAESPSAQAALGKADWVQHYSACTFVSAGSGRTATNGEPVAGASSSWASRQPQKLRRHEITLPSCLQVSAEVVAPLEQEVALSEVESKSAEWRILERATGLIFSSRAMPVDLDSLRTAKVVSALRREVGVRLPRDMLKRCATLGELLDKLSLLTPEGQEDGGRRVEDGVRSRTEGPEEHAAWGLMWNSKCHWTLCRDKPFSEATLRAALQELIGRHAALCAELADPMRLFTAMQEALAAFDLWRCHGCNCCQRRRQWRASAITQGLTWTMCELRARTASVAQHVVCWSFKRAWPRIRAGSFGTSCLWVAPCSASEGEARRALWKAPSFVPPFQVSLARFGEGEDEGALVNITVTHMLSDGYTIVPLLADLAHLVQHEEGGGVLPLPPPVPSALAALERRIFRTIESNDRSGDAVTHEPIRGLATWSREPSTTLVSLPAEVVQAIKGAARSLAISDDIVMLTAVGVALAQWKCQGAVPVAMIAPQRDGPGESDMVGLFADIRCFLVLTEGLSFAGAALRLHHIVNERLWRSPPAATQFNMPLVNFEWTDFEVRNGFRQLVRLREGQEQLSHDLKVAVDQPDRHSWRMRVSFDWKLYGQEDQDRFISLFQTSLFALMERPLVPIWAEKAVQGAE